MIDGLSVSEPRWLKTRPITFPNGPTWLIGSTWYRGMVINEPIDPKGVIVESPDGSDRTRLVGASIDWDAGNGGPQ